MGYEGDKLLEEKLANQIKAFLGVYFIRHASWDEDVNHGTDFMILSSAPIRVAARLRRFEYYENLEWRNQFTIRWERPSGALTEIHKIRRGDVDYLFYGFIDKNEKRIIKYLIGDLKLFRMNEPRAVAIIPNKPHDSDLAVYSVNWLPNFVLKCWDYDDPQAPKLFDINAMSR